MAIHDLAFIILLEPFFLYVFNDIKTWDNEGFEFEIKDSLSSQIFETLVALTWDNVTVPFSSHGELGLTINVTRLNKLLWLIFIFFFSNISRGVGGHWCSWPDSLAFLHLQPLYSFWWVSFFSISPPNKTAYKTFAKTKLSDDMRNSDALVREKWVTFKNFSFYLNFSFSLFF